MATATKTTEFFIDGKFRFNGARTGECRSYEALKAAQGEMNEKHCKRTFRDGVRVETCVITHFNETTTCREITVWGSL